MKIKSRDQRIAEYNDAYPVRSRDTLRLIEDYFKDNNLNMDKACKKASEKAAKILEERSYESIRIILYEYPFETIRPRAFKNHIYSPNAAANKTYLDKALHQVVDTLKLICTPAEVNIDAYLEMPSKVPPDEVILFEAKILHPIGKSDADNIAKAYLDMMTDVLFIDDDIIYKLVVNKWYSLQPRVEIMITYEKAVESDYIYHKLKSRKGVKRAIKEGLVKIDRI